MPAPSVPVLVQHHAPGSGPGPSISPVPDAFRRLLGPPAGAHRKHEDRPPGLPSEGLPSEALPDAYPPDAYP
ncbi:hypothetical protein TeGR_g9672, partial [Tetraparma gracilis]